MLKKTLKTNTVDGETLYLTPVGDEWKLTIDPPYRYNGTQKYDGWFNRFFSSPRSAKASVTRKFGKCWNWID